MSVTLEVFCITKRGLIELEITQRNILIKYLKTCPDHEREYLASDIGLS